MCGVDILRARHRELYKPSRHEIRTTDQWQFEDDGTATDHCAVALHMLIYLLAFRSAPRDTRIGLDMYGLYRAEDTV